MPINFFLGHSWELLDSIPCMITLLVFTIFLLDSVLKLKREFIKWSLLEVKWPKVMWWDYLHKVSCYSDWLIKFYGTFSLPITVMLKNLFYFTVMAVNLFLNFVPHSYFSYLFSFLLTYTKWFEPVGNMCRNGKFDW